MIAVVPDDRLSEYFARFSVVLIIPGFFLYYNAREYLIMFGTAVLYAPDTKKFIRLKGDKMPVGAYYTEEKFQNKTLNGTKCKSIYLYSDGIIDQFGGKKGKNFITKISENY